MIISLIVAADENNVIGNKGILPWPRLEADMQYFRKITERHPVIMGRKTFESIGRALPDRMNIIITHAHDFRMEDCRFVHSLEEAMDVAYKSDARESFIIGGAEIYRQALPLAQKIYLTRVHGTFTGDTKFPDSINWENWQERTDLRDHSHKHDKPIGFTFFVFERRSTHH